jgi:predicted DNA binding CopG/RHH family protein
MRKLYDFSKSKKNPYVSKKTVTIRIDSNAISYFKSLSEEVGVPYQNLINLYLSDCAARSKKPNFSWK